MTLTNSPMLGTAHKSDPYVIWRWVPEGPQYVTEVVVHDHDTGIIQEMSRLDVPEGAILGLTPNGKFMVGEVVYNRTAL